MLAISENQFPVMRDLVIAPLIPIALTFPRSDPLTGYGIPRNSLARLVGLLHCHHKIDSYEALRKTIERCGEQLYSIDQSTGTDDLNIHRWMLRHAQSSMESVETNLARGYGLRGDLTLARQIIQRAEDIDLPKLLTLAGDEIGPFEFNMLERPPAANRLTAPTSG